METQELIPRTFTDSPPRSSAMQSRRSAFKSRANPRSVPFSRSASKIARFMRSRRAGGGTRVARRKGFIKPGLQRYEAYANSGPRTRVVQFRKTLFNVNAINGSAASYGALSAFGLSGVAGFTMFGVPWQSQMGGGAVDVPDLVSLKALFSKFTLDKVIVRFRLNQSEFSDGVQYPQLWLRYITEFDPAGGLPGSQVWFDGYDGVKMHHFSNDAPICEYTIYPKRQVPVFDTTTWTGTTVGYKADNNDWVDLNSSATTQHLGLAYFFNNIPTGQSINVDVEYCFRCKDNS